MGLIKAIKNFKWGYLLISVILCLAGVCFVVYPNQSMTTGSYVIGGASLLVGIILVIKVLADRKRSFSFAISVICSVLTVTCGVVALIIPEEIFKLYPMFIGLFIVIDGAFKLQTVINAKRYRLKMWWFLLLFAIITIACGFLTIRLRVNTDIDFVPFSIILGIALFADGLENFFSLFYLGRIVSKAKEAFEDAGSNEDKGDVYEDDAVIANSYSIKDDDNIITVEILPNEKKELNESPDKNHENKTDDNGHSKDDDNEKKEEVSNLPIKSPYESYSK